MSAPLLCRVYFTAFFFWDKWLRLTFRRSKASSFLRAAPTTRKKGTDGHGRRRKNLHDTICRNQRPLLSGVTFSQKFGRRVLVGGKKYPMQ